MKNVYDTEEEAKEKGARFATRIAVEYREVKK